MGVDESYFSALAQPGVRGLRAYDPGHDLVAWRRRFAGRALTELGSNENSFGPSPLAMKAAQDALQEAWRYPDPLGGDLKRALASLHGVNTAQIYLGNGSHEILMQLGQAFCGPQAPMLVSEFCFAVYPIAAQASAADLLRVPALPVTHALMPRGHDVAALIEGFARKPRMLCLANPNNPTGTWLQGAELEALLKAAPTDCIVVVDEAYAEYVDAPEFTSAVGLLPHYPNLVVTRTFSKAYALAGLRVGYALGHPGLIAVLERLRESFNLNHLGLAAAEAALADTAHLQQVVQRTREQRGLLEAELRRRGLEVGPSQTNFLLVDFGSDAEAGRIEAGLLQRGVIPRPMRGYGLGQCLRITVGTEAENAALLAALDEVRR